MRRKEERSKQGQTNKAKQHSTPKAVTFPKKNELPRVGLKAMTLVHLHMSAYIYMFVYVCAGGREHGDEVSEPRPRHEDPLHQPTVRDE